MAKPDYTSEKAHSQDTLPFSERKGVTDSLFSELQTALFACPEAQHALAYAALNTSRSSTEITVEFFANGSRWGYTGEYAAEKDTVFRRLDRQQLRTATLKRGTFDPKLGRIAWQESLELSLTSIYGGIIYGSADSDLQVGFEVKLDPTQGYEYHTPTAVHKGKELIQKLAA